MVELRCTHEACSAMYTLAVDAVIRAWTAGDQFGAVHLLASVVEPLAEVAPPEGGVATPADLWNHLAEQAVPATN